MFEKYSSGAKSQSSGRLNKIHVAQFQKFSPYKTSSACPGSNANDNHNIDKAPRKKRDDGNNQKEYGYRGDNLNKTHAEEINLAPKVTKYSSNKYTYQA